VASISFDKGFTRTADRELLSLYVPTVVMPKRGRKNAAETQRESEKKYVGYGVLSYNLHVIGRELLARQRARGETLVLAA
jgi:hypothetical protein